MKRPNKTNARLLGLLTLLVAGCGSEDKPATENTTPDSSDTAGNETSASPGNDSTAGETDSGNGAPPGVGDPVLEEVPPETELSDLDDAQRAEVCEAYVKTSTVVSANMATLCPAQALFQASQDPEVTNDATYRAECGARLAECETQVAAAATESPRERCENGAACGASVKDFNDCNAQIAALNVYVLEPLTNQNVPECSQTTKQQADTTALLLGLSVASGINNVTSTTGGSPTDEDGPCARINEACPELGVALGAFSELGSQLP